MIGSRRHQALGNRAPRCRARIQRYRIRRVLGAFHADGAVDRERAGTGSVGTERQRTCRCRTGGLHRCIDHERCRRGHRLRSQCGRNAADQSQCMNLTHKSPRNIFFCRRSITAAEMYSPTHDRFFFSVADRDRDGVAITARNRRLVRCAIGQLPIHRQRVCGCHARTCAGAGGGGARAVSEHRCKRCGGIQVVLQRIGGARQHQALRKRPTCGRTRIEGYGVRRVLCALHTDGAVVGERARARRVVAERQCGGPSQSRWTAPSRTP